MSAEEHPYSQDSVSGLLKLAVWYRSDRERADRCFNNAVEMIEHKGGVFDPNLLETLRAYAKEFHDKGRPDEAKKLLELAQQVIEACPGSLYPDGAPIPWYHQPTFHRKIPPFPVEIRASRGEAQGGCGCLVVPALLFVAGCVAAGAFISLLPRDMHGWAEDIVGLGIAGISLLGGLVYIWRERDATQRERAESWFKLSDEGIEYHSHRAHYKYLWSEITRLVEESEYSSAEYGADACEVHGPRGKFRISARFFQDDEVQLALGVCKMKSGK